VTRPITLLAIGGSVEAAVFGNCVLSVEDFPSTWIPGRAESYFRMNMTAAVSE
jgi:hypothetical protein